MNAKMHRALIIRSSETGWLAGAEIATFSFNSEERAGGAASISV